MAAPPLAAELKVMLASEKHVLEQLTYASNAIDNELSKLEKKYTTSAKVERAQLRQMQATIKAHMDDMWVKLGVAVKDDKLAAAAASGEQLSGALNYFIEAGLTPQDLEVMKRSLIAASQNNLEAALKRVQGRSYRPLSQAVYSTSVAADGYLQTVINTAFLKGANWATMAKAVREHINPNTPGGTAYAAKRLARTEINNAFHATAVDQMRKMPFVDYVEWSLSGSHRLPDQCNEYAEQSHYNGGEPGIYPNGDVPERPHPQCLCFVSAVDIGRDQFIQRFKDGQYDAWLKDEIGYEPDVFDYSPAATGAGVHNVTINGKPAGQILHGAKSQKWYAKGDPKDTGFTTPQAAMQRLQTLKHADVAEQKVTAKLVNAGKNSAGNPSFLVYKGSKYLAEVEKLPNGFWKISGGSGPTFGSSQAVVDHLVQALEAPVSTAKTIPEVAAKGLDLGTTASKSFQLKQIDTAVKLSDDMMDALYTDPSIPEFDLFSNHIFAKLGQGNKVTATKLNGYNLQYFYDEAVASKTSLSTVIKAFDHRYALELGLPNEHFFEKKMYDYLSTESGAWKAKQLTLKSAGGAPAAPTVAKAVGKDALSTQASVAKHAEGYNEISTGQMLAMHQKERQWTAAEKKALQDYTGSLYRDLNRTLRENQGKVLQYQHEVKNIDSAMREMDRDFVVHRGTTSHSFGMDRSATLEDLMKFEGKVIKDEGYMSTSVGSKAAFSHQPINLEIEVPKGSRAAYLKPISHFGRENELLLARGTEMKVISVRPGPPGNFVVRVRIVKQR